MECSPAAGGGRASSGSSGSSSGRSAKSSSLRGGDDDNNNNNRSSSSSSSSSGNNCDDEFFQQQHARRQQRGHHQDEGDLSRRGQSSPSTTTMTATNHHHHDNTGSGSGSGRRSRCDSERGDVTGSSKDLWSLLEQGWRHGLFSDIRVDLKGRVFDLHRIVLCQSPYFKALLCGEWLDSRSAVLRLPVDDPLVTPAAFELAMRSLYSKDRALHLTEDLVKQVYATASFLQLWWVCLACIEYIRKNLSKENVVDYCWFVWSHDYMLGDMLLRMLVNFCSSLAWDHQDCLSIFVAVPLTIVKQSLMSDNLLVASEKERFWLAMSVFGTRLSALGSDFVVGNESEQKRVKQLGGDGDSSEDWVYSSRDAACSPSSALGLSDEMIDRDEGGIRIEIKNFNELMSSDEEDVCGEEDSIQDVTSAMMYVLCKGVFYEHLEEQDIEEVEAALIELPPVMDAFKRGMAMRRTYCDVIVHNSGLMKCGGPVSDRIMTRDFRFADVLPNVGGMLEKSDFRISDGRFYGGSLWGVTVVRIGENYGFFLFRGRPDCSSSCWYKDPRRCVPVRAKISCCDCTKILEGEVVTGGVVQDVLIVEGAVVKNYIDFSGHLPIAVLMRIT